MSRGATRTPTIWVGQDNAPTASPSPAAVPPVPRGVTMASGRSASWLSSSRPAGRCPTTARGCAPPDGIQRTGPMRRAASHALSRASGRPAGERARTTSAARAAHAVATARLASVSGCGNWASTVRAPSAPAWTVVARQWLEPVPPAGRYTTSARAGPSRNSSPPTLLPPQRGEDRSSRLSQSAAAPHAAASPGADSSGVGQSPRLPGASAPRIFGLNPAALDTHAPFRRGHPMRVATDYIRHAARLARKAAGDPLGAAPQPPDPEFYGTLANALEEIAAGPEQPGTEERSRAAPAPRCHQCDP